MENKKVGEALLEAKRLAGRKQWRPALAAVRKADAVPDKSAYADYKIDEFEAYLLTQLREYAQAAQVFEHLARSAYASAQDAAKHWRTAAQLYLQTRSHEKAAAAASQALKLNRGDAGLLELLGQSQYLAGDYSAAAETLQQLVQSTGKGGKQPAENWLQMMLASYSRLNDQTQVAATWEALLRNYPRAEYWRNVLKMKAAAAQSELLELGYRRLMFDLGVLEKAGDYEELALNAIDSGAPGLAVRILNAGFERGRFTGEQEARFNRMLEYARSQASQSEQRLSGLNREASLSGETSIRLGRLHLGQGRYDEAIAALSRGLESGDLSQEERAQIDLGIAYLRNDQPEKARAAFQAIDAKSQWHDLAQLWELHARDADG